MGACEQAREENEYEPHADRGGRVRPRISTTLGTVHSLRLSDEDKARILATLEEMRLAGIGEGLRALPDVWAALSERAKKRFVDSLSAD